MLLFSLRIIKALITRIDQNDKLPPWGVIIMLQNMGTTDRVVRVLAVFVIAALYFSGQISGIAVIILGIIAVALLATGVAGFCPAYFPFKISTRRKS